MSTPDTFNIPIIDNEAAGDSIYFLPMPQRVVVYLRPGQREATPEQEMAAVLEAYMQAAKRGEVAILRGVKP